MSDPAVPTQSASEYLDLRRARIADALGDSEAQSVSRAATLDAERRAFFVREAEDLYHNELAWEQLTDEESVEGGHLTEQVFPGLLALVDGLLLYEVREDALAPASPHPDAVEAILDFLADRAVALSTQLEAGIDSQRVLWAREMTADLIDLVLYRLHDISPADREGIEERA